MDTAAAQHDTMDIPKLDIPLNKPLAEVSQFNCTFDTVTPEVPEVATKVFTKVDAV
ncbi:MAG: hypothetical protein HWD58_00610 [Bacteroidota bacterium]|nr:MAG: hypothetical protein HWD58_00610 [Bacteroidota bacterium]